MENWSAEQVAAFVNARAAAGGGGLGDMFYSRQDVSVGTDQAGGTVKSDNRVPVTTTLTPPESAGKAATDALGIGKKALAGAGGAEDPEDDGPPIGADSEDTAEDDDPPPKSPSEE